ncbi:MAG TPA: membrane protein insertase YidC [Acidimicrobiales bacterium]|nr:membrane protein insertase YidC [Acidimicrobiales bacterium]
MQSLIKDIGRIFQPLLDGVGGVLAFFYSIIPNYPIDVALLTIVIMALLTPLTVKSTKNMAAMQALGPEMKKLQQKYKGAENRTQMNEEMMKLYKEHNVNPASGCLPMLLQMPAFFVLYSVIRGITNTVTIPAHTVHGFTVAAQVVAEPRYIPKTSAMYLNIHAHHGQLISFGMDFSEKLLSRHSSIFIAIPYLLLVVGSVALQYLQMARLNARNPQAAQANPQAAMLQKYMPLIFGFIYINVAAILNVYFIVSSAIRIGTQEVLFRKGIVSGPPVAAGAKGPVADRTERALPKPKAGGGSTSPKAGGTANGSTPRVARGTPAAGAKAAKRPATPAKAANPAKTVSSAKTTGSANGSRSNPGPKRGTGAARGPRPAPDDVKGPGSGRNGPPPDAADGGSAASKEHPRSKAKRERKAR